MENDKVINCLMELLKGENFMSADYTNIALQNGTNLNVLREIYLCACDKISVKDVQEVIDNRKTDVAGYLRKIRYQKACGVIIGKGNNTLKDMSKLADAVQACKLSMEQFHEKTCDRKLLAEIQNTMNSSISFQNYRQQKSFI